MLPVSSFPPPLCSAGVGRTGVFITLSIVLERMRYEGVVDIFQTVKMLRTQRPAMVQTEVRGREHLLLRRSMKEGVGWAAVDLQGGDSLVVYDLSHSFSKELKAMSKNHHPF